MKVKESFLKEEIRMNELDHANCIACRKWKPVLWPRYLHLSETTKYAPICLECAEAIKLCATNQVVKTMIELFLKS